MFAYLQVSFQDIHVQFMYTLQDVKISLVSFEITSLMFCKTIRNDVHEYCTIFSSERRVEENVFVFFKFFKVSSKV